MGRDNPVTVKLYRATHKEQIKATMKNWRSRNPDKVAKHGKTYWERHHEELTAKHRIYALKNKERITRRKKEQRMGWRKIVIHYYSNGENICACCKESLFEFLSIDHINGGGKKHIKSLKMDFYKWLIRNNFPTGYRVLCYNCNFCRGRNGYCPHERLQTGINNQDVLVVSS